MNRAFASRMYVRYWLSTVIVLGTSLVVQGASDDELARRASWQAPDPLSVRDNLFSWLESRNLDDDKLAELRKQWQSADQWRPDQVLEALINGLSVADSRVAEVRDFCTGPRPAFELPDFAVMDDAELPTWVQSNLRLLFGRWLATQQLFDESAAQLESVQTHDVVDPAALLFFQSVVAHRRLEKDRCLATLLRLLENEDNLPQRYLLVARLMQSDIEPLQPDSLDEISRLMGSIQVRLQHGRAGKRVRNEEDDVIAKLDKLIEQLEEQASSASAAAAAGGAGGPSTPMQDSMPGGGSGPGNVDPKQLGAETDWGNLPPKDREEALQELSKDLPSHFRDVIEEYFRKLAREDDEP